MFFREKKQDKKEEAVEKVLCEKYNSYYRMAYSFVRNEADACDIVQEGAYKAIRNSKDHEDENMDEGCCGCSSSGIGNTAKYIKQCGICDEEHTFVGECGKCCNISGLSL